MSEKNLKFYSAVLILLNVIWGGTYIASKIPLAEVPPVTFAFLRFSLTGLIMMPFLVTIYRNVRLKREDLLPCTALGLMGFTLAYMLQNTGIKYTKTMNAALEVASEPITLIMLAAVMLKEKITGFIKLGALLSTAGVLFIVLPPELSSTHGTQAANSCSIWGDVLVLLSTLCCALYTIMGRNIVKRVPSFAVTAYSVIIGSILLFPFALYEGGFPAIPHMSFKSWMCVLYLSAVATAFAYFVWYYLLEKLNASFMGNFLNIQPLIGILLGNMVLNEPLTKWTFIGAAFIISGVYMTSLVPCVQHENEKKAVTESL